MVAVTRNAFGPDEARTDAFQVIAQMQNLGFTPKTRIAFLQQGEDVRRSFFENAARTGGFDLKYFNDRDQALLWLARR